jgi:hypothetical protein
VFCGIDVGLKKSVAAIIDNRKLIYIGSYENLPPNFIAAGIDAPLSFPKQGTLRECERILLKMGIRLFPSGAAFFRRIVERGMQIADELRGKGIEVFEVYPYATRVVLKLAPDAKKHSKNGRVKIIEELSRFIEIEISLTHDEIDAVIAALTVQMHYKGKSIIVKGSDGSILLPKASIQQSLVDWQD